MQPLRLLFSPRRSGWLLLALLPAALFGANDEPVAVFADLFNGYHRTRLTDGSFKPELYTFGEGGCVTQPVRDAAMQEMTFRRVATAIATPLARLNYRPARSAKEAELLIVVFWGATEGSAGADGPDTRGRVSDAISNQTADPSSETAAADLDSALWMASLENQARDRTDNYNARVLGYTDSVQRARFVRQMSFAQDILAEIADNRYYVVLQAFDFKAARELKKLKPLWTARISMSEAGDFGGALDHMLRHAAKYFGQETKGLKRDVTGEGTVKLGPMEYLETVPGK